MSDVNVDVQQYSAPPIQLQRTGDEYQRGAVVEAALELIRAACVGHPSYLTDGMAKLSKYVGQIEASITDKGGQSGSD